MTVNPNLTLLNDKTELLVAQCPTKEPQALTRRSGLNWFGLPVHSVHQSLALGMSPVVAILMGVVTGICGGVLRDIVCNEIPLSLKDHRPYALCAFAGGVVYILLSMASVEAWAALAACVVVTVGFRVLSILRNWTLPGWRQQ